MAGKIRTRVEHLLAATHIVALIRVCEDELSVDITEDDQIITPESQQCRE